MASPSNLCGTCTACCRVYAIKEPTLIKRAGDWCMNCSVGKGCNIYGTRPKTCVEFKCLWLQSQETIQLPVDLRPDKCKVVFNMSTNPRIMTATTLPGYPDAWKRPSVRSLIERMQRGGLAVSIGPPASRKQIFLTPDFEQREVELTEPDENGIQWSKS